MPKVLQSLDCNLDTFSNLDFIFPSLIVSSLHHYHRPYGLAQSTALIILTKYLPYVR